MTYNVADIVQKMCKDLSISKIKLGELAHVKNPSQTVNNWISRNSIPSKSAKTLSLNTGYNYHWIMTGENIPYESNALLCRIKVSNWDKLKDSEKRDGDYLNVPILKNFIPMNHGENTAEGPMTFTLPFRSSTLDKYDIKIENIKVLKVTGDSMLPQLRDGDYVAINTADNQVSDGKIYAVRILGTLRVKSLILNSNGTITVRSLNPAYDDEIILPEQIENGSFKILGRMWWYSSLLF